MALAAGCLGSIGLALAYLASDRADLEAAIRVDQIRPPVPDAIYHHGQVPRPQITADDLNGFADAVRTESTGR